MKKVGKIKTIYRAFFAPTIIENEIWQHRMEICDSCEFNSKNTNLKGLNKLRAKLFEKPFCTQCGCQIYEKTSSPTESCGLEIQGEIPKWNRIKVETINKYEMNLITKNPEIVNVDLQNGVFIADLGTIERKDLKDLVFVIAADTPDDELSLLSASSSCSACLKLQVSRIDKSSYELIAKMNWRVLNNNFGKSATIAYSINGNPNRARLNIQGTIV